MITRMSELFLRTLRDDPADAEVPSHKLLIRAGYIRPIGPGLYSWLPLGLRVLRKIEKVVRDEMNAIGGQEILFPALLPRAPYEVTNRWTEYGDGVLPASGPAQERLPARADPRRVVHADGQGEYSSYKDFPLLLFQIQTKYRDEGPAARRHPAGPRVPHEGLVFVRRRRRGARRPSTSGTGTHTSGSSPTLGVRYVIVSAVSGAMGGSASEEFLAESEIGEDTFVRCLESGYAANVEAVITAVPESPPIEGQPEAKVYDTPGTPTIATLVDWAKQRLWTARSPPPTR